LGSVVGELAGGDFRVTSLIPNGLDVHEWEPSAKDIETLDSADLVVENGLGLEGGMEKALAQARASGRRFFTASDHITVRHVGEGEGIPSGDPDQAVGAADPHLWTDPRTMKAVVSALAEELQRDFGSALPDKGAGLAARAADLERRLDDLDAAVAAQVASLPAEKRKLVTGHESLGYFAQRYGFTLVGALIPSLSTEAESSASDLAKLKGLIAASHVSVIFTELGTPPATVHALATEAHVRSVELSTHALPPDGSYFSFERGLAANIVDNLRQ
ncbi:MAG TPA: metal ABC transporter substrate-binding protein, partial [Rectinemataceae bacterium]|nr:metal ABC transporter substrate-binding protein [Rectinemataceae bacterium]